MLSPGKACVRLCTALRWFLFTPQLFPSSHAAMLDQALSHTLHTLRHAQTTLTVAIHPPSYHLSNTLATWVSCSWPRRRWLLTCARPKALPLSGTWTPPQQSSVHALPHATRSTPAHAHPCVPSPHPRTPSHRKARGELPKLSTKRASTLSSFSSFVCSLSAACDSSRTLHSPLAACDSSAACSSTMPLILVAKQLAGGAQP